MTVDCFETETLVATRATESGMQTDIITMRNVVHVGTRGGSREVTEQSSIVSSRLFSAIGGLAFASPFVSRRTPGYWHASAAASHQAGGRCAQDPSKAAQSKAFSEVDLQISSSLQTSSKSRAAASICQLRSTFPSGLLCQAPPQCCARYRWMKLWRQLDTAREREVLCPTTFAGDVLVCVDARVVETSLRGRSNEDPGRFPDSKGSKTAPRSELPMMPSLGGHATWPASTSRSCRTVRSVSGRNGGAEF